jgi:hypothetical protein
LDTPFFKTTSYYGFTSLGVATSFAWLFSIGVSSFEGGRGYVAFAIFFIVFIAYTASRLG